jgi:hypothetical protein
MWEQLVTLTPVMAINRCSGFETLNHVSIAQTFTINLQLRMGTVCFHPKI